MRYLKTDSLKKFQLLISSVKKYLQMTEILYDIDQKRKEYLEFIR